MTLETKDIVAADGERRWTAVLMADMANSSAVTEAIGSERVYRMMSRIIAMAVAAAERNGGKPLGFAGDSILASFGAPVASEDSSLHACRAALEFMAALDEALPALERDYGVRPAFRVGISGGMVVVGHLGQRDRMEINILGQPVNIASRLQEIAQPGQILLGQPIFDQVEGDAVCEPLGPRKLKGLKEPLPVYALTGLAPHRSRFAARLQRGLVSMVGREDIVRALQDDFGAERPGWSFTLLRGEPGIGKSRLLHDLSAALGDGVRVLSGQCRPDQAAAPYAPVAEMLRQIAGATAATPADEVIALLTAALQPERPLDPLSPLFGARLTGAKASDPGQAILLRRCLRTALQAQCAREPTLLTFEDLHWADAGTLGLLGHLSKAEAPMPCRVVATSRPQPVGQEGEADQIVVARTVPLDRLTRDQTVRLAAARLQAQAIAPDLAQLLWDKTEGNPLFVEETLRYLLTTEALQEGPDGMGLRPGAKPDVASGNLQLLVLQRVDQLPQEVRNVLRTAATLGREFDSDVLRLMIDEATLRTSLGQAQDSGLIERTPGGGPTAFRFSHALLRDAIYGSLLDERRAVLHGQVGRALAATVAADDDSLSDTLGLHFRLAGDLKRAVPHLVRAAAKRMQVYDLSGVDRLYSEIRGYLDRQPDLIDSATYNTIAANWVEALTMIGDFAAVRRVGEDMLPTVEASGDARAYERALAYYASALNHTRDYPRAIALSKAGIAAAEMRGDDLSAAFLHLPLLRGYEETEAVPIETFEALVEKVGAIARAHGEVRLEMQVIYLLSARYRSIGYYAKARQVAARLRAFADEHNDLRAEGFANWTEALILALSREIEKAREMAGEGLRMTLPDTADARVIEMTWVGATVMGPEPHKAKPILDRALAKVEALQDHNLIYSYRNLQSYYSLRTGALRRGWDEFQSFLSQAAESGSTTMVTYGLLNRAEIALIVAGLLPEAPPAPGQPDRSVRERVKPGLRDILLALSIRMNVRRMVRADIERFRAMFLLRDGALYARSLIYEAVLSRDAARRLDLLQQARTLVAAEGVDSVVRHIDLLLARG